MKKIVLSSSVVLLLILVGLYSFSQPRSRTYYLDNNQDAVNIISPNITGNGFKFAVMGDIESRAGRFERLMKAAAERRSSLVLFTGDLVNHNSAEEWKFFLQEIRESLDAFIPPLAVFAAPGNHDIEPGNASSYSFDTIFGPRQFSFVFQNSLFVILDNSSSRLSPSQYRWLEGVLERHNGKVAHIFLFMHYPSIPFSGYAADAKGVEDSYRPFHQLVKRYKVDYVFSGHYHSFYTQVRDGVTYLVTGGGGAHLKGAGSFHHMIEVTVQGADVGFDIIKTSSFSDPEDGIDYLVKVDLVTFLKKWFRFL